MGDVSAALPRWLVRMGLGVLYLVSVWGVGCAGPGVCPGKVYPGVPEDPYGEWVWVHIVDLRSGSTQFNQYAVDVLAQQGKRATPYLLEGLEIEEALNESYYFPNHPEFFEPWAYVHVQDVTELLATILALSHDYFPAECYSRAPEYDRGACVRLLRTHVEQAD